MTLFQLTGKINEPVKMTVEAEAECVQTNDVKINLKQALDRKSAMFTPSENAIYAFDYGPHQFIVKVGEMPPVPDPEVPPEPEQPGGTTVIDFGISFNQPVRTLTKHGEYDKFDKRIEARAGDNRQITIGNGKMEISGDQVRAYIHIPHYNAQLDYDRTFEGKGNTEDDGSDDLRSRHNEGEIAAEKFNKIGGEITSEELGGKGKCKREDVHGTYEELKSYSCPKVTNGERHHVTYICMDEGSKKIRLIKKINGKEVLNVLDEGAPDTFFDKSTILRKSYFRIRNNGKGKTIVENPTLTLLPVEQ